MKMQSIFKLLKLVFIYNSCDNERKSLIKFEANKKTYFLQLFYNPVIQFQ
jgi:hypothetical protein